MEANLSQSSGMRKNCFPERFFNNKTRKQSRIVVLASNISVRSWIGKWRDVVFGVEGGEEDPQGVLHLLHLLQTVFRLWRLERRMREGGGLRRRSSDKLVKIGWRVGAEGEKILV